MSKKIYFAILVLMFACIMTVGESMARFVIQSVDGNGLQAACFVVYAAPTQNEIHQSDREYNYGFEVSNFNSLEVSEVAIAYDVVVSMPEGFSDPQGLTLILERNGSKNYPSLNNDGGKLEFTFERVGNFQALTRETHYYILKFVDDGVSENTYIKGIGVHIVASQIE